MIVMRIAITPSLNASSLVLDMVYPGAARGRSTGGTGGVACLAAVRSAGLSWCVMEGDRAGEVGHRSLDERLPPCGGGPARPGDKGCGERRGAGERCRADPADLTEAGPEPRWVGIGRTGETGDRR